MYAFDCGANHVEVEIKYLTELSDRLNTALGKAVTHEHETAVDMSNPGKARKKRESQDDAPHECSGDLRGCCGSNCGVHGIAEPQPYW
jgi:hypothetical protein